MKPAPQSDRIADYGLEAICDDIRDGTPYRAIAAKIGVSEGLLRWWLDQDVARSARARETRVLTAGMWDEKSEEVIEKADDPFQLDKAKQLAHHYRWRASKIAPADYGDKVKTEHSGLNNGPIEFALKGYAVAPAVAETMNEWTAEAHKQPEGE